MTCSCHEQARLGGRSYKVLLLYKVTVSAEVARRATRTPRGYNILRPLSYDVSSMRRFD